MATNFRQYKEHENRVHEQLYENLSTLNYFYQPSSDFKRVFKKDMFVKNNKSAFYEVVYYLLNILNPELAKQKLTTWPPYEIRRENKFRSELLQYINELNTIYDHADIPHIMPSHLISPGGFKFTRFMLKLSQLVVYEHIRETKESALFSCPKPNKSSAVTKAVINNMKTGTSKIESLTRDYLAEYECHHKKTQEQASSLVTNLANLDEKISDARRELSLARAQFNEKYPTYPDICNLQEKIKLLQSEWDNLKTVHDLFSESNDLLSYLTSNNLVLEHNKSELKLPISTIHPATNTDQLDLAEMFHGLEILLEQKSLELPNPTASFIGDTSEKVQKLNERFSKLEKEFSDRKQQTRMVIRELLDSIKLIEYLVPIPSKLGPNIDYSDEMLGVHPLEDYTA